MSSIIKDVEIRVLDKLAVRAVVKEFRNSEETSNLDLYVYDLLDENENVISSDRYAFMEDAPFKLTKKELNTLSLKEENLEEL